MLPAHRVIGHKEYGNVGHPGRKTDPIYSMNWRRNRVATFTSRGAAAPVAAPEPIEEEYPDMRVIQHAQRGIAVVGPNYFRQCRDDDEVRDAVDLHGSPKHAKDPAQFDRWVAQALSSDRTSLADEGLRDFIKAEVERASVDIRAALTEGYDVQLEPKDPS